MRAPFLSKVVGVRPDGWLVCRIGSGTIMVSPLSFSSPVAQGDAILVVDTPTGYVGISPAPTAPANVLTTLGDMIVADVLAQPTRLPAGAASSVLTIDPTTLVPTWEAPTGGGGSGTTTFPVSINLPVVSIGAPIPIGKYAVAGIDYDCLIIGVRMVLFDATGTVVDTCTVNLNRTDYATLTTTTINASPFGPTAAAKYSDTTLSGWYLTALTAEDTLEIEVVAAPTTATRIALWVETTRTLTVTPLDTTDYFLLATATSGGGGSDLGGNVPSLAVNGNDGYSDCWIRDTPVDGTTYIQLDAGAPVIIRRVRLLQPETVQFASQIFFEGCSTSGGTYTLIDTWNIAAFGESIFAVAAGPAYQFYRLRLSTMDVGNNGYWRISTIEGYVTP